MAECGVVLPPHSKPTQLILLERNTRHTWGSFITPLCPPNHQGNRMSVLCKASRTDWFLLPLFWPLSPRLVSLAMRNSLRIPVRELWASEINKESGKGCEQYNNDSIKMLIFELNQPIRLHPSLPCSWHNVLIGWNCKNCTNTLLFWARTHLTDS